ncbi:hypothetical protein [Streptosporangium sp. V21-05]|uniref:hypothetical protein n=1 Tax=Streptosporangium sp. V21-05 TaxID=3446115 RepID=UPI003F52AB62
MFQRARGALGLIGNRPAPLSLATADGPVVHPAERFPAIEVAEVMRGRVTFVGLPPVDLGPDIDWRLDPYPKGNNHGLDQDIALLAIGCRLRRERWRDLAIRRMTESAELSIDAQGALHEQAPRYGVHVHRRLGTALEAIGRCGAEIPAGLAARRTSLDTYVSHATQPDGRLVPIGDSPADTRPGGFPHGESTGRAR